MKKPGLFLVAALSVLLASPLAYSQLAQKIIHSFDAGSANWVTGVQPGTTNAITLSDYPDDYVEGAGSMQVNWAMRNFAASWGTWSDCQWTFPTPLDISAYDDIRFDVKILTPPTRPGHTTTLAANHNIQFVIDLYDSVYYNNAGNVVLWRYTAGTGDYNLFYYPHTQWVSESNTGWFEVVIPMSAMRYPSWYTPIADGVMHKNHIVKLGFGCDGDSSGVDSVKFLIDNLRATKKQSVVQLASLDGPASNWTVALGAVAGGATVNRAAVSDYPDDYVEGSGSMLVDVALRGMTAGWGTWTDIGLNLPHPVNATGATELRFWYKTLKTSAASKDIQFVVDLWDSIDGRGQFGPWRWANGAGYFGLWAAGLENNNQHTWTEVVVPIKDLSVPSWAATDTNIHLDKITQLHIGVDGDSSGTDSVQFLLDNFYFTKGSPLTGISNRPGAGLPGTFTLDQNYPNPFNPATKIEFSVPYTAQVQMKVYDLLGQEVMTLVNEIVTAGRHAVTFDASRLSTGVYLYKLTAGSFVSTKKMVLLK